jgi:excinuclease UvrABC nuclease subunit
MGWLNAKASKDKKKLRASKKSGCYAIYTYDGIEPSSIKLVYIGTTDNLDRRISNHTIIKTIRVLSPLKVTVKYKEIDKTIDRRMLELKLIDRLKPVMNQNGVK